MKPLLDHKGLTPRQAARLLRRFADRGRSGCLCHVDGKSIRVSVQTCSHFRRQISKFLYELARGYEKKDRAAKLCRRNRANP